ncbi:flagellar motor switch phosphatase FliY [Clostridium akagii]|uniref:flagellar motor switch phosphatase FliY n=1 Tax=Clostridium akagii TaxID=91623 RepID=UPI00047CD079|nr:flagellar motor switch phosphatase FliY [Clostridium akagii]
MSDGFLSQEEIDSLLNGGADDSEKKEEKKVEKKEDNRDDLLSDIEKDLLGEIGNISMGSASTALSTVISQQVNITTPVVSITTLKELRSTFEVPNIALDVKYTSGIVGENLLVMKVTDAGVIANLMMGGDGKAKIENLSEIELSAVSEAMNQMIGSAATSMATMLLREVNISPPTSEILDSNTKEITSAITDDETIVEVAFRLTIGDLVDSTIMQVLPIETAKKISAIMMGVQSGGSSDTPEKEKPSEQINNNTNVSGGNVQAEQNNQQSQAQEPQYIQEKPIERNQPPVEVQRAAFQPLQETQNYSAPKNIDLIMDVPLEISVVLGRTKKNIRDILNFGTGSLIELDKLAEEPVEILVNGKKVAYGEVVVVDENFGVRITSIVSSEERIRSIGR